jgi:hypothetical protein
MGERGLFRQCSRIADIDLPGIERQDIARVIVGVKPWPLG